MVGFCSYNPSRLIYLWNGVLLFEQPLRNYHARLSQGNTLYSCHNLKLVTTLLQGCSKVAYGIHTYCIAGIFQGLKNF